MVKHFLMNRIWKEIMHEHKIYIHVHAYNDFLFSYLIQIQGKYQTHFVRENSNFENYFVKKTLR